VGSWGGRGAVRSRGVLVEVAAATSLFAAPRHPYTRSLLAAVPRIGGPRVTRDFSLEGEPPNPRDIPTGCRFRTRCPIAEARCASEAPALRLVEDHLVACHLA